MAQQLCSSIVRKYVENTKLPRTVPTIYPQGPFLSVALKQRYWADTEYVERAVEFIAETGSTQEHVLERAYTASEAIFRIFEDSRYFADNINRTKTLVRLTILKHVLNDSFDVIVNSDYEDSCFFAGKLYLAKCVYYIFFELNLISKYSYKTELTSKYRAKRVDLLSMASTVLEHTACDIDFLRLIVLKSESHRFLERKVELLIDCVERFQAINPSAILSTISGVLKVWHEHRKGCRPAGLPCSIFNTLMMATSSLPIGICHLMNVLHYNHTLNELYTKKLSIWVSDWIRMNPHLKFVLTMLPADLSESLMGLIDMQNTTVLSDSQKSLEPHAAIKKVKEAAVVQKDLVTRLSKENLALFLTKKTSKDGLRALMKAIPEFDDINSLLTDTSAREKYKRLLICAFKIIINGICEKAKEICPHDLHNYETMCKGLDLNSKKDKKELKALLTVEEAPDSDSPIPVTETESSTHSISGLSDLSDPGVHSPPSFSD